MRIIKKQAFAEELEKNETGKKLKDPRFSQVSAQYMTV